MFDPAQALVLAVQHAFELGAAQAEFPSRDLQHQDCREADDVVREVPGFRLWEGSSFENFAAFNFRIEPDDGLIKDEVRGPMWELVFEVEDEGRVWSSLEIIENYRAATLEQKGRILSEGDVTLDLVVPLPDKGTASVHLWAQRVYYELTILNKAPFEKQLTFSAREMQEKIDFEGRSPSSGYFGDRGVSQQSPAARGWPRRASA